MKHLLSRACLLALALTLCGAPIAFADGLKVEMTPQAKKYKKMFEAAADEFNVPVEILEAIAYSETRWQAHVPKGSVSNGKNSQGEQVVEVEAHDGKPIAYGIMGLHDDAFFGRNLYQAAGLIREDPSKLKTDTASNIRGAAALLSYLSGRKTRANSIEQWAAAIATMSGIPQKAIADMHAYEILNAIRLGPESTHYALTQKHVDLTKVYTAEKLRVLAAPRILIERGVPDPKLTVPAFDPKH